MVRPKNNNWWQLKFLTLQLHAQEGNKDPPGTNQIVVNKQARKSINVCTLAMYVVFN